jgi:hypothetical protein
MFEPCQCKAVAGGMDGRRDRHLTILERVSRSPADIDGRCPARHCWVANAADGAATKRPGLLIEWRRTPTGDGWEGLVVYAAQLRSGSWALVEEWLDATLLTSI